MPPRSQPLPEATTESAREARKSFYCELCSKGYARMNDFEAHENSYDHQHRRRLKELRQVSKDPNAASRARLAEERANEGSGLRTISSSTSVTSGPGSGQGERKKPVFKPVFKSTLQPRNAAAVTSKAAQDSRTPSSEIAKAKTEEAKVTAVQANPLRDAMLERGDKKWEFEEEQVDPNDLPVEAGEWWPEAYRPRVGPTRLGNVEVVSGRLQMI